MRKYDASGNEVWTLQFGTSGLDYPRGIAANSSAVYIGGATTGALPGQASAGGSDAYVVKLAEDNLGPITSNVVATPNPVAVNNLVTQTATVDDSTTGGSNIDSAEYNIAAGSFSPMVASDSVFDEVSEDVTATVPAFSDPGLNTICVRGTDAGGNVGNAECIVLAVYDPAAGFVTGGGRVNSPAGADLDNPSAAGPANFGFVSKYLPGRTTPSGNLEFQFKAGNLNFKSTIMDWLVVTGEPRAQFMGEGTINGATLCKFQVDAWDGSFSGSGADAFGLKIFACGPGSTGRYSLDATPLTNGSIIIHRR